MKMGHGGVWVQATAHMEDATSREVNVRGTLPTATLMAAWRALDLKAEGQPIAAVTIYVRKQLPVYSRPKS